MSADLSRREWLACAAVAGIGVAAAPRAEAKGPPAEPFVYCLNTATIQGQKVPLAQEVEISARAGYQAIEPWTRELDQFVKDGGSLKDLGKKIADAGLVVPSAIGFCEWVVDDDGRRKKGLEEARRCMEMLKQIGGRRLAAPPVGATRDTDPPVNLLRAAERYHDLLAIGANLGIVPQVEVWGFSKSLSKLGEAALVALESGHPQACVLADVYHLHKGGSGFATLKLLGGPAVQVFHVNDYPEKPARAEITDAHRVYPGDGVAPLKPMLRDLRALGRPVVLSLELFNRDYWKQDAAEVARTGLEKMKAAVRNSLD